MLSVNFSPFPTLETERLELRQFLTTDVNDLFMLRSDSEIMKFIPRPRMTTQKDAEQLIQKFNDSIEANEAITWAITEKNNRVIGTIGYIKIDKPNYRAEVGYLLSTQHRNRGIMHEALRAVLDYGFLNLKLHSIEAVVHPENVMSSNLLVKNGFVKEGSFKDYQFFDGKFIDADIYSLLTFAS